MCYDFVSLCNGSLSYEAGGGGESSETLAARWYVVV